MSKFPISRIGMRLPSPLLEIRKWLVYTGYQALNALPMMKPGIGGKASSWSKIHIQKFSIDTSRER
jgi:hypothetical protein